MKDPLTDIQALGFDLDNTLYSRDQAVNAWIRSIFPGDPAMAQRAIAHDNSGFIPRSDFYGWVAERVDWAGDWRSVEARFQREVMGMIQFDPAIRDAVEVLAGRYRLGLLTNGESGFQLKKFAHLGISGHFDPNHVFATGDIGHHKPDSRAFQALIDAFELEPGKILFVGDNPGNDIEGAAAMGMRTCWIQLFAGHQCAVKPDLTVKSAAELPNVLP